VAIQTIGSPAPPNQMLDVHSVQSTNPKATHHPDGKKKQRKKGKGDKKPTNNDGRGNKENNKLKYPCNICMEDHLTHQFPRLAEAQNLLAQ
jgi:hypothetical protein